MLDMAWLSKNGQMSGVGLIILTCAILIIAVLV